MAEFSPLSRDSQSVIGFDNCLKELYHPMKGLKQLHRKLKQTNIVEINNEDITLDRLNKYHVYVIAAPQVAPSPEHCATLKAYIEQGGSVFLLLGEGGSGTKYVNHWGKWLSAEFGVAPNEDCVARTVLHKYFHPKEVAVTNGITNREFNRQAGKPLPGQSATDGGASPFSATQTSQQLGSDVAAEASESAANNNQQQLNSNPNLTFVYPYGMTLTVRRPSIPVLSSGFMAYPLNCPIVSVYEHTESPENKKGKLMVMGSAQTFEDEWFQKEENDKLCTVLFNYLLHKFKLNQIDAEDPEITDYNYLPDTASLAERLRVAVEEQDELPRDFTKMFDLNMFKFDTDLIPEVIATHESLGVKHEPLTLIHPEFQVPLPPRLPATFEPTHRELPPPALDLFDLDDHFASEKIRLSQLTNKCQQAQDLNFFIQEAADIMGVTKKLRSPKNKDPRAMLDYVFRQIVTWKKGEVSQGSPSQQPGGGIRPGTQQLGSYGKQTYVVRGGEGANDPIPFQGGNWVFELEINLEMGIVRGNFEFLEDSEMFTAQTCEVEGQYNNNGNGMLEFRIQPTNIQGNAVVFVYTLKIKSPPEMMQGTVQWDVGYPTEGSADIVWYVESERGVRSSGMPGLRDGVATFLGGSNMSNQNIAPL